MSDDALLKEEPQQEFQAEDEGYTQALLAIAGLLSVLFMFLFYLINPFIPVDSSGLFSDTLWISIPLGVLLIAKMWRFSGKIWDLFDSPLFIRRGVFFIVVWFHFPFYMARFINGVADTSMPQVREVLLVDKDSSQKFFAGRGESNYLVKFQFDNRPVEFIYANSESSSLRKKKFHQIAVGKSKIEISIHEGFLGYPWYEVKRVVL